MRREKTILILSSGAEFSDNKKFRYRLWRIWDTHKPTLVFIMLNPSKAGEEINDQTVWKCIGFADRLGYGGIEVLNLFAYCATYPMDLERARYPVGEFNDAVILSRLAILQPDRIVCAWGANARGLRRPGELLAKIALWGHRTCALRLLKDGIPEHPLYLPYSCKLVDYQPFQVMQ